MQRQVKKQKQNAQQKHANAKKKMQKQNNKPPNAKIKISKKQRASMQRGGKEVCTQMPCVYAQKCAWCAGSSKGVPGRVVV